jgi:hypothetical protein
VAGADALNINCPREIPKPERLFLFLPPNARAHDGRQHHSGNVAQKIAIFLVMGIKRMEILLFLADLAAMVALVWASLRKEKALAKNA